MIHNFSAGPGVLPRTVLQTVQAELVDYQGTGISVLEMSHRSSQFKAILSQAESNLRQLLDIPPTHQVLFMQGGASTQFSSIVYNLITELDQKAEYIVTGQWSSKALKEAQRLGVDAKAVYTPSNGPLDINNIEFGNPTYVYYCDNETVDGFEMPSSVVDALPPSSIVVCDMSSNFATRKVNIAKYGVIFGGAQKNMGPAGLTIVIVRNDLLDRFEKCPIKGPLMQSYKVCADNGSMYNTPPTFAIYVSSLVFKYWNDFGGLEAVERLAVQKSQMLYSAIDSLKMYRCPVQHGYRSRVNVVFRIVKEGVGQPDLEKRFCKEAEERGMICLAGHRSVGGIRASLYNALAVESVQTLVEFMKDFEKAIN